MAIGDITKTNTIQQRSSANSAVSSNVSSNASINVPVGQYQYDELLKKLNITREQLEIILQKDPEFLSKSFDEQSIIVLSDEPDSFVPEVPLVEDIKPAETLDSLKEITKDDLKRLPALSTGETSYDKVCDLFFNSSIEDKKHILAIELLKNEKREKIGPEDIRKKIEEINTKIYNAFKNLEDKNQYTAEQILDQMFFTIAEANVQQKSYKELCDNLTDHNVTTDDKMSLGRITDYMLIYAKRCENEGIEVNSNLVKQRAERVLLIQDAFKAQVEQLKQKLSPELLAKFKKEIGEKDITCSAEMDEYIKAYFDFIKENWDEVKDLDIVKNNLTVTQIIYSYMQANNSNGDFTLRLEKLKPYIEKEKKLGSFGVEEVADNDRICKFENELPETENSEVLANFYCKKIEEEVKKQFGITGDDIPADKRADFNKEFARRIRAAALDAYNPPHGNYDLGEALVKEWSEFCAKNNLKLDIGTGSYIEVATHVLVENGTLDISVVQHFFNEYTRYSEESGDTTGLDVLMSGVAKRSDADAIMKSISEMISNSETLSDATKDFVKNRVDQYSANRDTSTQQSGNTYSSESASKMSAEHYTSYQTNPITSSINETPFITTEPAKSVYQQLISGDVSAFNELSKDEQVRFLKTLKPSDVAKMPVDICEDCPALISSFIREGRGLEIVEKCDMPTGDKAIKLLPLEDKKRLAIENPYRLAKGTYQTLVDNGDVQVSKSNKPYSALA